MPKDIEKKVVGTSWWIGVALVVAVVLAYLPVWHAGFIWDDDVMLTANGCVVGPFGLKEIWTTAAADICPFTITTFWFLHKWWGLSPLPYHVFNVLLHAANAVLLWQVLRRLRIPGAWLGAALWALHPVQVESAAWIAEMKNTESGFFFLLAILLFVAWRNAGNDEGKSERRFLAMALCSFLAVTSKSSTVILPVVLCLCSWWMDKKWDWQVAGRIWPVWLMSLLAGLLSLWTQDARGAGNENWLMSLPLHFATAGAAVWFYLGKLFWPVSLLPVYPAIVVETPGAFKFVPLVAALLVLVVLWVKRASWGRPWFFAYAYFLVALLPVLGLANNYAFAYSPVFDHFQYLASMGPLVLVGAGLVWLTGKVLPGNAALVVVPGTCLAALLAGLSWRHAPIFRDEPTLWNYMLEKDPTCWVAYTGLGNVAAGAGKIDEAIDSYLQALRLHPTDAKAHNNLGVLLVKQGKDDEAIRRFQNALAVSPNYARAHLNLGRLLATQGHTDQAIDEFARAAERNPDDPETQLAWGRALIQKRFFVDAIVHLNRALMTDPKMDGLQYEIGNALLLSNAPNEAVGHFQKAHDLKPDDPKVNAQLGLALAQTGQSDRAIEKLRKAAEADSNNVDVLLNLGNALAKGGQADEAKKQLQKVAELAPKNPYVYAPLGKIYMQGGELNAAVEQFKKGLELTPDNDQMRYDLALALVKLGRDEEAIAQLKKQMELKPTDAGAYNNIGIIYARKGQLKKAIEQFNLALKVQPDNKEALSDLAHAEEMLKKKPDGK